MILVKDKASEVFSTAGKMSLVYLYPVRGVEKGQICIYWPLKEQELLKKVFEACRIGLEKAVDEVEDQKLELIECEYKEACTKQFTDCK